MKEIAKQFKVWNILVALKCPKLNKLPKGKASLPTSELSFIKKGSPKTVFLRWTNSTKSKVSLPEMTTGGWFQKGEISRQLHFPT